MTKLSDSQAIPSIRTASRRRQRRLIPWVMFNVVTPLILLGIGVVVIIWLGTVEPRQREPADQTRIGRLKALTPVRVVAIEELESTGQQLQLRVDGTVVPYRESKVAAEVAGRIVFKAPECESGSYVTAGQLLMKIDPTDHELEVERLTRLQEQEYEALGEVDQEMVNSRRLIDVANEDVELQQREVTRLQSMPKGFASRGEIDQASRALLSAKQQLVTSENQLALLKKRRVRLEASERLAATQLKAAGIDLERTEIRAPIDGVIVNEDADMNSFVARGNLLVTIEDTSKVEVATSLRMDQLYWVLKQKDSTNEKPNRGYELPETPAVIEYELSGQDGVVYRWNGRLLSFDGIGVDSATRTVPVRVVVDRPSQYIDAEGNVQEMSGGTALVRGMFVRVNLLIKPRASLVAIPARALQPGNRVFQFLPDETVLQAAKEVRVNTAETLGQSAETRAKPNSKQKDERERITFDPGNWDPGRIVVRRSISPIDTLSVGPANQSSTENRVWVCEVRDQVLKQGSFVVVSPIGNINDEGMPARALRANSSVKTASPDVAPASSGSTVAKHDRPAEEA